MTDPESSESPESLHEAMAVANAENRRNAKRIMEALKQFGTVLETLTHSVQSVQAPAIAPSDTVAQPPNKTLILGLIELNDRVERIGQALTRRPAQCQSWWPPARRALEAWSEDRERMQDAFAILQEHLQSLLQDSDLQRIPTSGRLFDPQTMTAIEAVNRPDLPDHSVLDELEPGWQWQSGEVLRAARVRVSRKATDS